VAQNFISIAAAPAVFQIQDLFSENFHCLSFGETFARTKPATAGADGFRQQSARLRQLSTSTILAMTGDRIFAAHFGACWPG
jgi:hypothetical protein